jgi:hypothetical protein
MIQDSTATSGKNNEDLSFHAQPVRVLHSQLTYRRGYSNLACSQSNILVATKPTPLPSAIESITGNSYSQKARPHRTPILLAQRYHGQYAITHLEWNQRGNYLASIDETGRLAVWEHTVSRLQGVKEKRLEVYPMIMWITDSLFMTQSTRSWTHVYCTDLRQPVVAFLWLNSERSV